MLGSALVGHAFVRPGQVMPLPRLNENTQNQFIVYAQQHAQDGELLKARKQGLDKLKTDPSLVSSLAQQLQKDQRSQEEAERKERVARAVRKVHALPSTRWDQ